MSNDAHTLKTMNPLVGEIGHMIDEPAAQSQLRTIEKLSRSSSAPAPNRAQRREAGQ